MKSTVPNFGLARGRQPALGYEISLVSSFPIVSRCTRSAGTTLVLPHFVGLQDWYLSKLRRSIVNRAKEPAPFLVSDV